MISLQQIAQKQIKIKLQAFIFQDIEQKMNHSFDKAKLTLLNRRNSIVDQDQLRKTSRTNSNSFAIQAPFPTQQTRKVIQKLQKVARQQKLKRKQIQTKYEDFKQRFVNRERQFYRILSKLDTHMPGDSKQQDYDNYVGEIYNKILCTFQAFNQKARSLLDDRYSELYRLMERRIDILMQKMDKELAKYRKISHAQRKEIQQAIREIGAIAAQTQKENAEFRKKNQCMDLKLSMLNDEKRLLLEEIIGLKEYIKESKKNGQQKRQKERQNGNEQFWKNMESIQMQKVDDNKAKHRRTLTSRTYRYDQPTSNNTKHPHQIPSNHKSIDTTKLQRQSLSQQSIISHLKQQLTRQKNKNFQLVKFSLELQTKQERIRELVDCEIRRLVTRASQNSLASSMVVNDRKKSLSEMSEERSIIQVRQQMASGQNDDNKKIQAKLGNEMNKSLVKQHENQLIEEQKRFSTLVSEINRILHLAQTSKMDMKFINNTIDISTIDETTQKKFNQQHKSIQIYSRNNSQAYKKQTLDNSPTIMNLNMIVKPESKISNRSVTKRYDSSHRAKQQQSLFVNYSPLDLMDITKSIEIK